MYAGAFGEQANLPQPTFPFFGNVVQEGHFGGTNVLGRWTRNVEENNTYSLQAYFDRSQRLDTEFNFTIDTYDVEFRQNLKHSDNHVFTWGTGYRLINDDIQPSQFLSGINPPLRTWDQATAFLQEEMPFVRDDLRLTVGSKFMYYFFTGFEYQPTARLLWEIDDQQVAWGAVSRAVRTPSRLEEDAAFAITAAPAPVLIGLQGGGGSLVSEELLAYELGYRKQVTEKLSFELATFYNVYRNLIESVPVGLTPGPPPIMATQFRNSASAQSYGIELNAQWELRDWWRLRGWYSFMRLHLDATGTSDDPGDTPINQAYLMSSWDLPKHVEFDLMPRVVENLPFLGVPGYATLDARLGWRPGQNWEFSIIGQNLLAPHHLEYVGQTTIPSEVNRGVFAQVVWRH
jgi:iron complex outermembrane receptor protein